MHMTNKDVTFEELLIVCLDGEHHEAPDNTPRTPECPSFRDFEAHVNGSRFLSPDAMRHVNRCTDYCQSIIEHFRRQSGKNQVRF